MALAATLNGGATPIVQVVVDASEPKTFRMTQVGRCMRAYSAYIDLHVNTSAGIRNA
jgi:hypothetical protein